MNSGRKLSLKGRLWRRRMRSKQHAHTPPSSGQERRLSLPLVFEFLATIGGLVLCTVFVVVVAQMVTSCAEWHIQLRLRQFSPLWKDPSGY